jgi:GGDEF domain-containing protein
MTIVNSDPVLDLGEVARALQPRMRSCLSTPLLTGDVIVGVLTLYSVNRDAFTEDHRRIVEAVARQVSQTIHLCAEFERERTLQSRDRLPGLPTIEHLERIVAAEMSAQRPQPLSIVTIRFVPSKNHGKRQSRAPLDQLSFSATEAIRHGLRVADVLVACDEFAYVALLAQTSAADAHGVARRIADTVREQVRTVGTPRDLIGMRLGVATAPDDGSSLEVLVAAARERERQSLQLGEAPPSIH